MAEAIEMSKYLQEKRQDEVELRIGCIALTCKRAGRRDVDIAKHYHDKYGFQVIRIGENLHKFNDGLEVREVPRIRHKGPERANH